MSPRLMDLTKGVIPVTALVAVIVGTSICVGFQKDTQSELSKLNQKVDAMQATQRDTLTLTEFDNWRLRLQWANRSIPGYDVPEIRK